MAWVADRDGHEEAMGMGSAEMKKARGLRFVGTIFGLIGGLFILAGVAIAISTLSFISSAERTQGVVVSLDDESEIVDGYVETYWYPIVEYAVGGREYSFTGGVGSDPPAYQEGDAVPVAYDPSDPFDAQIASFGSTFLLPVIFTGTGLVFAPIGVVMWVVASRSGRQGA